ncbi:hypothetical protein [Xenorhabdus sp. SGI246]|uniref:hypothetical protein n=1 Tax=Xenorhabdus sp. SGI246 TaxID=3158263 RepID=UPI00349FB754
MGNAFDFELHADENATKALAEIEARIKQLNPLLDSTREALRFGGSETLDNVGSVSNKLRDMSQFAKDNVHHIGAIIPPLKNVGELTAKYGGLAKKYGGIVGGVGAIGYGATKLYQGVRDAGQEAIARSTRAKNAGMSVADFTRMSGAMQISTGLSMDETDQSIESLYPVLQNALTVRNGAARATLDTIGVAIAKNKNGNADVYQTMKNLAAKWNNITPETQDTLREHLGLDRNTLSFLRDGGQKKAGNLKIEELLTKSDQFGLTIQDKANEQIEEVGARINEAEARIAGTLRNWKNDMLLTGFGQWDKGKAAAKGKNRIHGIIAGIGAFANPFSFNNGGDQLTLLKKAQKDDEFRKTLSFKEKTDLLLTYASEDLIKKLNAYYFPNHKKQSHVGEKVPDIPIVRESNYSNPLKESGKQPRGIRNNNPLNIEFAKQRDATVEDHPEKRFAKFSTPYVGLERTAWQLRRYFNGMTDNVKRQTVDLIVRKWAPPGGKDKNHTEEYIDRVAQRLGVGRHDRLDLNNHDVMYALMREMGMVESKSFPYSYDLVMSAITGTSDPTKMLVKNNASSTNPQISDNTEESADKQEQQYPSLYSKQKRAESEVDIAKSMAKAFQDALGDKPFKFEITLVNSETGERQKFQTKTAGKVTTSMRYP